MRPNRDQQPCAANSDRRLVILLVEHLAHTSALVRPTDNFTEQAADSQHGQSILKDIHLGSGDGDRVGGDDSLQW